MDKKEILNVLNYLFSERMINEWVFETVLEKIDDIEEKESDTKQNEKNQNVEEKKNNIEIKKSNIILNNQNQNIEFHSSFDENKVSSQIQEKEEQKNKNIFDENKKFNNFQILSLIPEFCQKINDIFNNSYMKKYYELNTPITPNNINNDKENFIFNFKIKKKDLLIQQFNEKYEKENIDELNKNFKEINEKWKKINIFDKTQRNNWIIKAKELLSIVKILSNSDVDNKQKWNKIISDINFQIKKNKF